jgi:hypothetical protein
MPVHLKSGLRISDQGVVFDPSTGESFTLNPTGLAIFRHLAEGADQNRIFEMISDVYQISRPEFDRYYLDFLSVLKSSQLLDTDA